ncbi:unnamed protein product [Echinostoma caproni]|uniref:Fibronectin type-III domain-containing protein n=1 Tax=Echinostoma caproni TaxID=27848 RepID=A0A183AXU5_9TREM|nr:unnamed protein product [Echinostoma caproni]
MPDDSRPSAVPVLHYVLEIRPVGERLWRPAGPGSEKIEACQFTVPTNDLKEEQPYEFQVTAVNKAGPGKPSSPSNPVQLGCPLAFVRRLEDVIIKSYTGEPVVLECELTRSPKESVKWTKDRRPLTSGNKVTDVKLESDKRETIHRVLLPQLTEDFMGEYKIEVEKISSSCTIQFQVPPTLRLSESFQERIVMKAGESRPVEIPFVAVPKATIQWTCTLSKAKRGDQKPRFKTEVDHNITRLQLTKVTPEDMGDYRVIIHNKYGEITSNIQLVVVDKPGPPRNPQTRDMTGEQITFTWEEPDWLGGTDSPVEYLVEYRETSMRSAKAVGKTKELTMPITELSVGKSYVFRVACKNENGQSDFVETQPVVMKLEFDAPSAPINVRASVKPTRAEPEEQEIHLVWDSPIKPDSAPVAGALPSHYMVEMKLVDGRNWQRIVKDVTIQEPQIHFAAVDESLGPEKLYEFRVFAVNKAGTSEPSKPSNPVELGVVLEFERPLTDLIVTEVKSDQPYMLECELSRKPRTAVAWTKDGKPFLPPAAEDRVHLINEGIRQAIVFDRLMDADVGVYAIQVEQLSGQAKLEIKAPPTIPISKEFEDRITLKAGTSKILEIPFVSTPKPKVDWTWAPSPDLTQEQKPRFKPDVVAGLTTLPLSRVKREDSGAYKVRITNDLGEVSIITYVTVIDKPSPPRNLRDTENTGESLVLVWDEPSDLGGCDSPVNYIVGMREAGKRAAQPVTIKTVQELKATVDGLKLDKEYIFSVAASNEVGTSQPVETKPIKMKYAFEVPGAPGKPVVEILETGRVKVSWISPTSDGGSPITEYTLESCSTRVPIPGQRRGSTFAAKPKWIPVSKGISFAPEVGTSAEVEGLSSDMQYEFRVCAVNKAGPGPFSPPSDSSIPLVKGPRVPDKPGTPTAQAKNDNTVTVSWAPSAVSEDFGPADAYQVEMEEDGDGTWQVVGTTSKPEDCQLDVPNLDNAKRYVFRVRGLNKEGQGEPSKSSNQVYLKKDAPLAIVKPLESISAETVPETVAFECHINKAAQKIQWLFNGKRVDSSNLRKYRVTEDVLVHRLDVLKVTPEDVGEYTIRVEKLESKARFDLELAPRIILPENFEKTIVLQQGASRTVEIPFVASPAAKEIIWYWNGSRTLPEPTKRTVPRNDLTGKAVLVFSKVERTDAGVYETVITNEFGEAKAKVTLQVLSPPGPVRSLEINAETPTEAGLVWKPPVEGDDGGSPITNYRVEQRILTAAPGATLRSHQREWSLVTTVEAKPEDDLLAHRLSGLVEGTTYSFAVSAVNAIGTGPRTEIPEGFLMKSPFDKPSKPTDLTVKPVDTTTVELDYRLPKVPESASLTEVMVEYRPKGQSRWNSQKVPVTDTVKLDKLDAKTEYDFRVSCANLAGWSEPSDIVRGQTKQPPKPPGPPTSVVVKPSGSDALCLTWNPPEDNGGSPITAYQIELTDAAGPERWKPIQTFSIGKDDQPLEAILSKLDESKSYQIRVAATNKAGTGKPSQASPAVTPGEAVTLVRPLEDIWYTEIPAPNTQAVFECELSHANCRVQWLRAGKPLEIGRKFDFTPEGCVYRLTVNDVRLDDLDHYAMTYKNLKTEADLGAKIPPALREDVEMSDVRKVRAGSNFVLEVPFKAYPKPTIKWMAQGTTVTESTRRYQVDTVAGLTSLSIQRTQRDDAGQLTVIIENEYGKLTWKCELIVIDKPGPVERLTTEVPDKEAQVRVTWKPPRDDGKSPVTGYELEYRTSKRRGWQQLRHGPQDDSETFLIPAETPEFLVPVGDKETANCLEGGADYLFRVVAVNEVGKSEPVETKTAIKAPAKPKPPKLKYDVQLESSRVSIGQKHVIPVSVEGEPVPKVTWYYAPDEKTTDLVTTLPSDAQTDATGPDRNGVNKVELKFRKATRQADGIYTIVAVNAGGEARAQFRVQVTGVPGTPLNLAVLNLTKSSVRLTWQPPTDTGGMKLTNYVIEQAEMSSAYATPSSTTYWQTVTTSLPVTEATDAEGQCSYEVARLITGKHMFFRVAAQNKLGVGGFAVTDKALQITSPHNLPGAPRNLRATVDKDGQVNVEWNAPQDDGGSNIINYVIERSTAASGSNWVEITAPDSKDTKRTLRNLKDGKCFIRVSAVNEVGQGPPSEVTEVSVKKLSDEPDTPSQPTVEVVGDGSVHLRWNPPLNEGLAGPVTGYEVQWCELGSSKWQSALREPCTTNDTRVDGLPTDRDLQFRVIAINGAGKSEPSESTRPVRLSLYTARLATGLKSEACLSVECPPKINYSGPMEIELIAGKSTIIEVPYSGAPAPDVNWSLNAGPLPIGPVRESPLASVDTVYGLTCLRLRHVTREATGTYKVLVSGTRG